MVLGVPSELGLDLNGVEFRESRTLGIADPTPKENFRQTDAVDSRVTRHKNVRTGFFKEMLNGTETKITIDDISNQF